MVSHIDDGETFELVKVGVPRDPTELITADSDIRAPTFFACKG